jgi:hypothetical protein
MARKRAIYRCIRQRTRLSTSALSGLATATRKMGPFFGRSGATPRSGWIPRSHLTAFTSLCAATQPALVSRSARMPCAPRPPPTPSTIRRISPRPRNGLATPTSPPPASTTIGKPDLGTVRRSRSTDRSPSVESMITRIPNEQCMIAPVLQSTSEPDRLAR